MILKGNRAIYTFDLYFQVVAAPQIGYAEEVIASAPPAHSEYAPPPRVKIHKSCDCTESSQTVFLQ